MLRCVTYLSRADSEWFVLGRLWVEGRRRSPTVRVRKTDAVSAATRVCGDNYCRRPVVHAFDTLNGCRYRSGGFCRKHRIVYELGFDRRTDVTEKRLARATVTTLPCFVATLKQHVPAGLATKTAVVGDFESVAAVRISDAEWGEFFLNDIYETRRRSWCYGTVFRIKI